MKMKRILLFAAMCLALTACGTDDTVVIFQVSDPQMGFQTRNADMEYETATLTAAVEAINATSPDVVVFTGDLVHDCWSEAQWTEFKRLSGLIDKKSEVLYIPGNHDIVFKGDFDMSPYMDHIGTDRFNVKVGNVMLTGINTDYIKYTEGSPEEIAQVQWLKDALDNKEDGEISIVFGHHPFFLNDPQEEEEYFNIRPENRSKYLEIFENHDVDAVFCGHKHDNSIAADGDIPVVTTSAIGKPLGQAPSGVRVIVCRKGDIRHVYLTPEEVPQTRKELIGLLY